MMYSTVAPQPRMQSPLAILKDPKRDVPVVERDIRVEDYLNDKIQTAADLKDLESLIVKVEEQKHILQIQLQDVRTKLSAAKKASTNRIFAMREQTKEFERKSASVQERLMIVTSSETPEKAAQQIRGPMEKLHKLELANKYIELLKEVGELKKQARECLPADPKGALVPYTRLKELAILLAELQEPTEGAAVHIVNYVQATSNELWTEMKRIMTDEFEVVLQKSKWPETGDEPTQEWKECFGKLLDLQGPELTDAREPVILLPMAVLAKTFVLQFRYHFFSDKPTNHPHALGDYFFEWFIGTVAKWEVFLRENVGPVLAAHFRGNMLLAGTSLFVDPVAAFITALLPVLKEKVNSLLLQISEEPQHLSKYIDQLLTFDDTVRSKFRYDAGNPEHGWKGLTWDVLDVWYDRWLTVEKDFAWKRYNEIINNPETRLIDFESAVTGKTRHTFASLQIKDLIVNITKQYKRVRRFRHKLYFFLNIQAQILDDYMRSLQETMNTYEEMISPIRRITFSKEQLEKVEGNSGLDRLCRVYCSADHLYNLCKEWANEGFFLDLWSELQARARNTNQRSNLAGDMSFSDVKDATSQAVGTGDIGSIFDTSIDTFERLRRRAERLIVRHLAATPLIQQVDAARFLEKCLSNRASKGIKRQVMISKETQSFGSEEAGEE